MNNRPALWVSQGGLTGPGGPAGHPMTVVGPSCGQAGASGGDPVRDLVAARLSSPASRRYTEEELTTGSETLTEVERQAVREKQAGRKYEDVVYDAAVRKLVKSAKVADARNTGKQRGQPDK